MGSLAKCKVFFYKKGLFMYYRHDLDYTYPERSDQHMLLLNRTKELHLDENYDYMPHGIGFRIKRALVASLLHTVVFPLTHLTHGLRIYGRDNLKKHRDVLRNGDITISKPVFMWISFYIRKAYEQIRLFRYLCASVLR